MSTITDIFTRQFKAAEVAKAKLEYDALVAKQKRNDEVMYELVREYHSVISRRVYDHIAKLLLPIANRIGTMTKSEFVEFAQTVEQDPVLAGITALLSSALAEETKPTSTGL